MVSLDLTEFHSSRLLEIVAVEPVAGSGVVRYRVVLRVTDTGELVEVTVSVPSGREFLVKDALLTAMYGIKHTRKIVMRDYSDGGEGQVWL